MDKVAILLATYNGSSFVSELLLSLSRQINVRVTIFISDHGSSDDTVNIIKSYCAKLSLEYFIIDTPPPYPGPGQNFFHLIRTCNLNHFKFVALCDQDDIWLPTKISSAINILSNHNADAYSSNYYLFSKNKNIKVRKNTTQTKYDFCFQSPGPGCTFLFTIVFYNNLRAFISSKTNIMKQIYYHDWFIYAYSRIFKYKWHIDHNSYINYRQHDCNDTGENRSLISKLYRFKLLWNNWAFNQSHIIAKTLNYDSSLTLFYSPYPLNVFKLIFSIHHYRRDYFSALLLLFCVIFKRFKPSK